MIQVTVTPAMGKRLIGKGMVAHPSIQRVLQKGTLTIIGGSTNGYVAEEILTSIGYEGFQRTGFRRGLTVKPGTKAPEMDFPGDVVIKEGEVTLGGNIFEIGPKMGPGDVVLKGGNAFDARRQPAVQIGSDVGGTALAAVSSVIGKRVELIVPIGMEKRVFGDVYELALITNAGDGKGPGYFPLPGTIFTEIDAIRLLTGAEATMISAGGVYGAEGAIWLIITGSPEQEKSAGALIKSVIDEPLCEP